MPSNEHQIEEYQIRVNRAINYINTNFAQPITLHELANIACFSKFHFHRIFKALLGETITDFIWRIRLQKAAHLLVFDRRKSVTIIGMECGFSSSQNFSKMFKQMYNVTPSQFRNSKDFRDPSFFDRNSGNNHSNSGNIQGNSGKDLAPQTGYIINQERAHEYKTNLQKEQIMNVVVKKIPEYTVAYVRSIGPYGPQSIAPAFTKLMSWAGPRGLCREDCTILGVSWDNPEITAPEKCRYDACIAVPEDFKSDGIIDVQKLPGGEFAIYHCEVVNSDFNTPWTELMRDWLPKSGYQPDDRPCWERYYNSDGNLPGKKWIVDLYLPVKPL